MRPPARAEQIRFLTNVQRLLAEGLFTATYKYALIAALADLSVESGDDSGRPLPLSTFAIAEKFAEYYWRHATPYATATDARVLRQNAGSQAKIISWPWTLVASTGTRWRTSCGTGVRGHGWCGKSKP